MVLGSDLKIGWIQSRSQLNSLGHEIWAQFHQMQVYGSLSKGTHTSKRGVDLE